MKYTNKAQRTWYGGGGSGSSPQPPSGCCYTLITVAALQALKGTNNLVQGTLYQITNVTTDWQVVILAESTNKVSSQGQGIYQNVLFTEAWYDLDTNTLERIYDPKYNNDIGKNTNIAQFVWNNANWEGNVVSSDSTINFTATTLPNFKYNYVQGNSTFSITNSNIGGDVKNNIITSESTLSFNNYTTANNIYYNNFTNNSYVTISNTIDTDFNYNFGEFASINIYTGIKAENNIRYFEGNFLPYCSIEIIDTDVQSFSQNHFQEGGYRIHFDSSIIGQFILNKMRGTQGDAISSNSIYIFNSTTKDIYNNVIDGSNLDILGSTLNKDFHDNTLLAGAKWYISDSNITNQVYNNTLSTKPDVGYSIVFDTTTITNSVYDNTITSGSYIDLSGTTLSNLYGNNLSELSYLNASACSGLSEITNNQISGSSYLDVSGGSFGFNSISCNEIGGLSSVSLTNVQNPNDNLANNRIYGTYINGINSWLGAFYGNIINNSSLDIHGIPNCQVFAGNNIENTYANLANSNLAQFQVNSISQNSNIYFTNLIVPTRINFNIFSNTTIYANNTTRITDFNYNQFYNNPNGISFYGTGSNDTVISDFSDNVISDVSSDFYINGITTGEFRHNTISNTYYFLLQDSVINEFNYNTITRRCDFEIQFCNINRLNESIYDFVTVFFNNVTAYRCDSNYVYDSQVYLLNTISLGVNGGNVWNNNITFSTLWLDSCIFNDVQLNTIFGNSQVKLVVGDTFDQFAYNTINQTQLISDITTSYLGEFVYNTITNCGRDYTDTTIPQTDYTIRLDNSRFETFKFNNLVNSNLEFRNCIITNFTDNEYLHSAGFSASSSTIVNCNNNIVNNANTYYNNSTITNITDNYVYGLSSIVVSDSTATYIRRNELNRSSGITVTTSLASHIVQGNRLWSSNISLISVGGTPDVSNNDLFYSDITFNITNDSLQQVSFNTLKNSSIGSNAASTLRNVNFNELNKSLIVFRSSTFTGSTDSVSKNTLSNSTIDCSYITSTNGSIYENNLSNTSIIEIGGTVNNGKVYRNTISNESRLYLYGSLITNIYDNLIDTQSQLYFTSGDAIDYEIAYNSLNNSSSIYSDGISNILPALYFNNLDSSSYINFENGSSGDSFQYNKLSNQSSIYFQGSYVTEFWYNNIVGGSSLVFLTNIGSTYYYNNVSAGAIITFAIGGYINNCDISGYYYGTLTTGQSGTLIGGLSTFTYYLDLTDASVYNSVTQTLTLTAEQQIFGGIFKIDNAAVGTITIKSIANAPLRRRYQFIKNTATGTQRFTESGAGATILLGSGSGANVDLGTIPSFVEFQDMLGASKQYEVVHQTY